MKTFTFLQIIYSKCNIGTKYVVSERKEFAGKKHSKLEI